ncbi:MAG: YbhB/YbcL family Raf kinase inhibitor-like protein [Gallionella sp.]|jgi:hypothetical protein
MIIESPSFMHEGSIPLRYTCDGLNVSPPLIWRDIPAGTKSLAIIVDDPDAPDPASPKMTWVHWVLYNIPDTACGIKEGSVPEGAKTGVNDSHHTGYDGPCPPLGRHRYFFKLYALNIVLPDLGHPTKTALIKSMQGHVIGSAQLIGLYQHRGAL